jgi:hypothetical protein
MSIQASIISKYAIICFNHITSELYVHCHDQVCDKMIQRVGKTMYGMLHYPPVHHFGKEPTAYNSLAVKKNGN